MPQIGSATNGHSKKPTCMSTWQRDKPLCFCFNLHTLAWRQIMPALIDALALLVKMSTISPSGWRNAWSKGRSGCCAGTQDQGVGYSWCRSISYFFIWSSLCFMPDAMSRVPRGCGLELLRFYPPWTLVGSVCGWASLMSWADQSIKSPHMFRDFSIPQDSICLYCHCRLYYYPPRRPVDYMN